MIIENEEVKEVRLNNKALKAKEKKEVSFDDSFEDVLKYQKEGYDLLFSWDKPLDLSPEQFKELNLKNKDRYYQAKMAAKGEDLIATYDAAQKPYKDEYSVRPGSPSEKLSVIDQEKGFTYRWELPARVNMKESQGWTVDHGKAKKQINQEAGDVKVIGTRDKAELVLMKIPSEVVQEREKKNRAKYAKTKEHTLETFERNAAKAGAKVIS